MAIVYPANEVMMETSRCLNKWREVASGSPKMEVAMGHYVAALEAEIRFWRDRYYERERAATYEEIMVAIDNLKKLVGKGFMGGKSDH